MSKFTRGFWKTYRSKNKHKEAIFIMSGRYFIAKVYGHETDNDTVEANASLIETSPELLETLKRVKEDCLGLPIPSKTWKQINKVIRKAEGTK